MFMKVSVDPTRSIRPQLAPHDMRALKAPSLGRTLFAIALDYAVIALSIVLALASWWLYPLAILAIAGRQHSLLIFMHEAAHGSLTRRRWLNDLLGNVLCAWPMLLDVTAFRHVHLQHHRHEGEPGDPDFVFRSGEDWEFPRPLRSIVGSLLRDFVGLNTLGAVQQVKYYGQAPAETRVWMRLGKVAFYVAVAAALYASGALALSLVFWLIPILTVLKGLIRVREIAEHYGLSREHALNRTRTTAASWLERVLIAPRNINYHLEHHYAANAYRSPSYWAALCECGTRSVDQTSEPAAHRPQPTDKSYLAGKVS
jgi:fatty acid desaturase